ncbi:NAD(P)H-binding protein [Zunongwangia sp. F363]|uniref:NAD(P)H-binding protein n=1 Tax=Autumnicola tepida TaxID=3075595 RepID=A0ABU3CBB5_9FLAO|nr:NAD(P)H-binding protein [Zunongwangia sp. F363]MDT0643622.1 NAD(P)H-binding protein [Zunongwangia sp. F363]
MKHKTAIVLGATGLTGGILLHKLLKNEDYSKIILFSRSPSHVLDVKIEEHLVDLLELEKYAEDFKADEVFCCIGTTKSKTPDKEKYKAIDYGIPVTAAKLCEANKIPCFLVVSAMGSDPKSKIFYNKVKGKMERDVLQCNIRKTYIFKPSLIVGNRNENRTGENIAKAVMKVMNPLLKGPLKKYKSVTAEKIADAMIFVANDGYHTTRIESDEIEKIAKLAEE